MFWRLIRNSKRKTPQEKYAKNLSETFEMGEHFILVWEELVSRTPTGDDIEQYLLDLEVFINRFETRWMGKNFKRLTLDNQNDLDSLLSDLITVNNMAVDLLNQYEIEDEIEEEVEKLANPEKIDGPFRSYDGWETHPYHYSDSLLEKAIKIMVTR